MSDAPEEGTVGNVNAVMVKAILANTVFMQTGPETDNVEAFLECIFVTVDGKEHHLILHATAFTPLLQSMSHVYGHYFPAVVQDWQVPDTTEAIDWMKRGE